jgi:hypothetical protein
MSTERDPNTETGGATAAAGPAGGPGTEPEQQDDLAHGGDEDKAEDLEKKAFGDNDGDGDADTPYVQFPG